MINHLKNETSPYLLQHANNPVEWFPWGQAALLRAKMEDKPVHLSIGYASCHWCHRMSHDCFENKEIALLLNEHFINIKVDRQERPDIDDIYQRTVQMTGQPGGWPLTIFMNQDGEPFFGGTYFPPEDSYGKIGFKKLLESLIDAWKNHPQDIQQNIQHFKEGFQQLDRNNNFIEAKHSLSEDIQQSLAENIAEETSSLDGGLKGTPKFPNVNHYDLVLRIAQRNRDPKLINALAKTLDGMAEGAIHDQIGGGFFRYSVTEDWSTPHFEKMLYDNGLLIKLYADSYRMTGQLSWRRVFEQAIDYLLRDLAHPDGGFFSAQDADSEGKEGAFYLWNPHQIFELFGRSQGDFVCRTFGISPQGNFEGGFSVPNRSRSLEINDEELIQRVREKLLIARNSRVRPDRDENIITSWNALVIQGLCSSFQATGHQHYLALATKCADFLLNNLSLPSGEIYRIWNHGSRKIAGFLDDYAFLANALLDLYESGFEKKYLERAKQMMDLVLKKFWSGNLYYTPNDGEKLFHRPLSPYDSALPSGLSQSVFALLRLHKLYELPGYRDFAEKILHSFSQAYTNFPYQFPHLLAAKEFFNQDPLEIVMAGTRESAPNFLERIYRHYLPNKVVAFAEDVPIGRDRVAIDAQSTAHVCRANTCRIPVTNPEELLHQCGL